MASDLNFELSPSLAHTSSRSDEFVRVFNQWVQARDAAGWSDRASRPLRDESIEIYRQMWLALRDFCLPKGIDPLSLTSATLMAYLNSRSGRAHRGLSKPYAFRMLSLTDKVLKLEARLSGVPAPACAEVLLRGPEFSHANDNESVSGPNALTDSESRTFIEWLTSRSKDCAWKDHRNVVAAALMLGSGLSPGDVRNLAISDCHRTLSGHVWRIQVSGDGNGPSHETPCADWTAALLEGWLEVRAAMGSTLPWLLPSTRSGRPWSKTSFFESMTQLFEAAGLSQYGSLSLRHTFALGQLRAGKSIEEVQSWLGIQDGGLMDRYKQVLGLNTQSRKEKQRSDPPGR